MKRWSVLTIIFAAAFIFFTMAPGSNANDQPELRYCCCYQAYEAVEKERISEFTKATGIKVEVSVMSSTLAYKCAINNACDIGSIALETLSFRHVGRNFVITPFCQDGFAVIGDPRSNVDNLSEKQVREIFGGEIINWKKLGGPDQPIVTVVPREDTGAYINFDRMIMKGKTIKYQVKTYESTKVINVVEHLPWVISFIARAATLNREGIKVLRINNLLPSDKNYPYVQVFYFISADEPVGPSKAFVDFAFSEKGIEIIKNRGISPILR